MTPWVSDEKAEGGYTLIRSIVCANCSYVIKEDGAIHAGGRYECPKCGHRGIRGKKMN